MSKFYKISGHCYIVENQNGFNNALYDYFECDKKGSMNKDEVRSMIQNFPKNYPTEIIIIDQSFECGRIYIEEFNASIKELAHMNIGFYL
jgi:hypothetical protein